MLERRNKYLYAMLGSIGVVGPLLMWFGFAHLRWTSVEVWWLTVIGTTLVSSVFIELDFRLNRDYYDYHDSKDD